MKKVLLTAMMVVVSTFAIANDNKPSVRVEKVGSKSLVVFVSESVSGNTQIKLKDQNGLTLYNTQAKEGLEFAKRFDLKSLEAGDYTIEIENDMSFTATPVSINIDSAWIKAQDQVTILKPVLRQSGEKLDIILPSDDCGDVIVTIFDGNFKKLASENFNGEALKRFDLSRLSQGSYTVKMTTKGRNFVQSVSVK
ncbi:hypothetical protein [Roseivirga sp.]|uniref:hypothetical protein n=1 Tax=Roseivirga sp. TaxID=1964215 RepID=UPI003B8C72A8